MQPQLYVSILYHITTFGNQEQPCVGKTMIKLGVSLHLKTIQHVQTSQTHRHLLIILQNGMQEPKRGWSHQMLLTFLVGNVDGNVCLSLGVVFPTLVLDKIVLFVCLNHINVPV